MEKTIAGLKKEHLTALLAGFAILLLVGQGCAAGNQNPTEGDNNGEAMEKKDVMTSEDLSMMMEKEGPAEDAMMKKVEGAMKGEMMAKTDYQYEGTLEDVSGGNGSGVARASFEDGTYSLLATFSDIPDPEGTDFYEGWIVRKEPFHFISTGVVEKVGGVYTNTYTSGDDLTDHDFYVLTLEPDDGDPAPAAHIVEGAMLRR